MAESSSDPSSPGAGRVPVDKTFTLRSYQKQIHVQATMLWQSYHESNIRKDHEEAEVKLLNFLSHMNGHVPSDTAIGGMPTASRLGLDTLSFMFRDFSDIWLSTRLPGNLLKGLEGIFERLKSQLTAELKVVVSSRRNPLQPIVVDTLHSLLWLMACLSGRKENHNRLSEAKFTVEVASLGSLLVKWAECLLEDKENGWKFVEMVTTCLLYIHGLYDPARMWKLRFVRELKAVGHIHRKPQYLPMGVEELFLECFKAEFSQVADSNEYVRSLQKEALHLFGAVISAHEANAFQMISPRTTGLVLSLFDPREKCGPLQELASKVFIKMIHIMHSKPGSELFEIDVLISGYLSFLGPRLEDGVFIRPCADFLTLILDSFTRLMTVTANKNDLSLLLVRVGCFEKINNVFALLADVSQKDLVSVVSCLLRAVCSVIRGSTSIRKRFLENRGFYILSEGVKHCKAVDKAVLKEFIALSTEESHSVAISSQTIKNPGVIHILLEWIPELSPAHRLLLLDSLILLIPNSIFNRHQCCKEGIIEVILQLLGDSQSSKTYLGSDIEEKLCLLFEVLAGHSVTSHHIKQLFSIMRPFTDKKLPSYYPRLLKSIHSISAHTQHNLPHYYFDMTCSESYISMPKLRHWCVDGFTFCSWINVSRAEARTGLGSKQSGTIMRRRMLFSVHSSPNAGFQAFLWEDILVVVVVTKRHYITINIPDESLFTGWHHVGVVFNLQGTFQKTCEVSVYIDGRCCCKESVKAPTVADTTVCGFIGSGQDRSKISLESDNLLSITVSTVEHTSGFVVVSEDILPTHTPLGTESDRWGGMTSLQGLIGPVCLFNDALTHHCIKQLSSVDPNDYGLFQPNSKVHDASNRLLVYYHPKACSRTTAYDLAPPSVRGKGSSAKIVGECYNAFKLKDVLNALGGVQSLLPLLESIRLPVKTFSQQNVQEEEVNKEATLPRGQECDHTNVEKDKEAQEQPNQAEEQHLEKKEEDDSKNEKAVEARQKVEELVKVEDQSLSQEEEDEGEKSTGILPATFEPRAIDPHASTSVAIFMNILSTMLISSEVNSRLLSLNDGQMILGALLAQVAPDQLTLPVLDSLRVLTEHDFQNCSHPGVLPPIVKHVIFNFKIWTKPVYEVRLGHLQYLGSIVKDRSSLCHKEWPPLFILDVISGFYLPSHSESRGEAEGAVVLTTEQAANIRVGLLSCVKYYAHGEMSASDVDQIVQYTLTVGDEDVQIELLQLLLDLVLKKNVGNALPSLLAEMGTPLVAFMKAPQIKIRLIVTQVLCALFNVRGVSSGPLYECLQQGAITSAVHNMNKHPLSSALIISLMELCVKRSDSFTDYISSLNVYMALLGLLKNMDMVVRHTVCQQTLSILHFNPHHIGELLGYPQWELTLLGLLTTTEEAKTPTTPAGFPSSPVTPSSPGSPWLPGGGLPPRQSGPTDMQSRLVAIVMEILGLVLWDAVLVGSHFKVWSQVFVSVDLYSENNAMLLPAHVIKQHVFDNLIKLAKRQLDETGSSGAAALYKPAATLAMLFEEFVTGNHSVSDLPQPSMHQLTDLALDPKRCTPELLKSFASLMASLGVHQSSFLDQCEVFLCRTVNRILLACLGQSNREYCSYGASQLRELFSGCKLSTADSNFTLYCLVQALDQCGETDLESDCREYIVTAIKALLLTFGQDLGAKGLKNLPSVDSNPLFVKEFLAYRQSEDWDSFMNEKVSKSCKEFCKDVLVPQCQRRIDTTAALKSEMEQVAKMKRVILQQNDRMYNSQVLDRVVVILEEENGRVPTKQQLEAQHDSALHVWKQVKRFFKEERGVWSSRKPEKYSWKLDPTENFTRMRMKLSRSYPYNKHTEASFLRDNGDIGPAQLDDMIKELMQAKDSVLPTVSIEGDDIFDEPSESSLVDTPTLPKQFDGFAEASSEQEHSVCELKCHLVLLTERFNGTLEVTTRHICFEPEKRESKESFWYNNNFKILISQLREIHSRRYNLVRTGLEFFLIDHTNYFINFHSRKDLRKAFSAIVSQSAPNLIYKKLRTPRELLESSDLTKKWTRGEISNFDYLIQLNTIAGRTYNDLNQYPVFPWVLRDYTSAKLDLSDPSVFRDLSKPMGCQSKAMEHYAIERFEEFSDPSGLIPKFNYGTHYSNAAGVMHYLVRLEPFTSLHVQLQSGRFDHAARQFISPARSFKNILCTTSDVKELVPEFFYLPEMFVNLNKFDFGKTGTVVNERVDSVELPTWATSPEEFVRIHREALESPYICQHLHEWIDLIFGYKQRGPEAEKANNVFYYCTYEGNVDLSKASETERRGLEKMIENFGQTPSQLFKSPHPTRLSSEEASRALRAEYQGGNTPSDSVSIFENFEDLVAYAVEIPPKDSIVFVSTPAVKGHAIIESGNPEKLMTVSSNGVLNIHSWLSVHLAFKKRPFLFHIDPAVSEDRSKWHHLGGPFAHNVTPNQNMFVASRSNKLLVSCGHWDNSFRVIAAEKGKVIARVEYHQDIVTCMSLDPAGAHLITGSCDLTCAIWDFGKEAKLFEHPLRTLYGHDDVVTCVDISLELDIAVSGSRDGTVIVHTVQQGRYVHTLKPASELDDEKRPRTVKLVVISAKKGRIVVYSELLPSADRVRPDSCLHLFTVNGKLLLNESSSESINSLLVHEGYLVTGSDKGNLLFRDINNLARLTKLDVKAGITCLALTRELSHLLVGLDSGKLLIVSPPNKRPRK